MENTNLNKQELNRYSRHLLLNEIGIDGQTKLKKAKVLVVGAGGLGSPVLQYLSAAGVGTIGIADNALITEDNLARQVLFLKNEIGLQKTIIAKKKLTEYNPNLTYNIHNILFTDERALNIIDKYDIIVDCTDNFPARYLLNDASIILNKVLVHAALYKFLGQISVFNYKSGPSYRCLYPYPPRSAKILNSGSTGILGAMVGIIGSIQAGEIIKIITDTGDVMSGNLFIYNFLNNESFKFKIQKNIENFEIEELIDYQEYCKPSL
ncbi:MAG: HesA/MoeB/ThiF family protein [Bacteroidales bacterium]|nr:HesA/MoeB/ThiF family protein [Bacteroidales bacterium]